MAPIGRAYVIKVALFVGFLFVLLNFYNYLLQSRFDNAVSLSVVNFKTPQWPKRTRSSTQFLNRSSVAVKRNNSSSSSIKQLLKSKATHVNFTSANTFSKNTSIIYFNTKNNSINNVIIAKQTISLAINSSSSKTSSSSTSGSSSSSQPNIDIITLVLNDTQEIIGSNYTFIKLNVTQVTTETSTKASFFQSLITTLGLGYPNCPLYPPNLIGPIKINTTVEKLSVLEHNLGPTLLPGGWYKPKNCIPKDRIALIIPYRDRAMHLPVFLANIHPFIQKQQNEYGIFVIEQISDGLFNRASLMNIGYVEALKFKDWDCFIFHDIDLLPMDDRNLYNCPDQPRHMSVAVDTFDYKLPYSSIFGGVSALTKKQFKTVNGFSNSFWGWGGEDDDMSNRLSHYGFHIARYPINIARYKMLNHKKEKANPNRFQKLVSGAKAFEVDGLNSLKYKIHYLERKVLYTWVLVELKQDVSS